MCLHQDTFFMYRLILKHCCLVLLFLVMGNNNLFAQSSPKLSNTAPLVYLAGKDSGNLTITELRNLKGLEVNAPYKIAQFTIVINDNKAGAKPLTYYTIMNDKFSKEVIKDLASRGVDFTFILDEVKVKDENGKIIKVRPDVFHVVADK